MQNQNKQMFSPPFNNGCFWTLANCKLLLLAVLLKLLVSIMVSTIARDFIDVREKKNSLFTDRSCPTLNTIMDCDDRIRDLVFPSKSGFCKSSYFPCHTRSRTFVWLLALWTRVCQLLGNTVVCFSLKISLVSHLTFLFHSPELSFWTHNASCSVVYLASVHSPLFFRQIV